MTSTARKLALLFAVALAAMALGASSASAQESSIEVVDEIHGGHCNPCYIHAVGESQITMGAMILSWCRDEWEAEIYENGSGHVYQYSSSNVPGSPWPCTRQTCNGVGEEAVEGEWLFSNPGEMAPSKAHLTTRICLDNKANPNATGMHCNLEVQIEPEGGAHQYGAGTIQQPCMGGAINVTGGWLLEGFGCACGHDVIEIVHL